METECPHIKDQNNYSLSLQGKNLYKDQCTKCFEDPKTSLVDLCLKCFNGSCQTHSQEHLQKFDHPLVLEFKIIPDEEKIQEYEQKRKENEGKEITKLAIGKPGGFQDLDSNEFTKTVTKLKCLKCNITLPEESLEGIVKSVKQTDSAFKKQDLIQWEDEAFPCEHTLTLQQLENAKVQKMSEATCSQCNLSTNLWMCLTCGNLGCGRKQGDGTGGNEHGLQHGLDSGHPVVVKMGTITPNGEASLYCYHCNNDVKDENLAEHLLFLGIDIQQQEKTEKTLAEMNLDLNLKAAFNSVVEEGKQLNPIFGKGFTGLVNLGNSCYINSVLQVIFHLQEFKQKYYVNGQNHMKECKNLPQNCYYCQFAKLAEGLVSDKYSIKKELKLQDGKEKELPEHQKVYQDGLKIYDAKKLIAQKNVEFQSNKMQDALEYFQHFLQFIQKQEKQFKLGDSTEVFKFKSSNRLQCTSCNGVKYIENQAQELKIPVRSPNEQEMAQILEENKLRAERMRKAEEEHKEVTVNVEDPEYNVDFQECAEAYFEGDSVEVNCPVCKKNTMFTSQTYCKTLPDYLIVPVQRFVLENWQPKKLNALIKMPDQYDFSKFVLQKFDDEILLPKNEQQGPQIDENALAMLMEMGMGKNRSIRALMENQNNPELAMNWLFTKMDDPSLDDPIKNDNNNDTNLKYSKENVDMIVNMGFSEKAAKIGLSNCDNNVERAMDFLFNHEDVENMELEEGDQNQQQKKDDESLESLLQNSKYNLISTVVHLGKGVHSGHYVSYIKTEDNKWTLFNDAKVAQTDEPVLGKGYFYIFKRQKE
ncbi:UBA-like protein [Pseudocohnilembus persalinus]|uniref:Ubiquitin carboxyl-terminal hydrolase n=1 Tax=Pseudocohnilembus persalinus TaxID=266149 RepID=A0A0V0QKR6_PSEPJ|nr:UBA-like protein [Pseudocohnilembus persalinus]|eukprot:KRX02624.1 UBA-like protein [Pseudocohnilembus persalinus]